MTYLHTTHYWPPFSPRHWPRWMFIQCNCPADLEKRRRRRAEQVIDRMRGTGQNLNYELDDWEQNDPALLELIDEGLFECEDCGWWCGRDEQSDCDGEFCDDCRPREND